MGPGPSLVRRRWVITDYRKCFIMPPNWFLSAQYFFILEIKVVEKHLFVFLLFFSSYIWIYWMTGNIET